MTSGFTFGGTAAQKTPSLSFGSGTGSLSFGTPNQTAQSTGLGFGTPASTALFGTSSTPATGLGFGAATTAGSTGFTFGGTATPQTGMFGAPATSTPQTGFSFGAPAATTPQTGLTFGTPVASSATTTTTQSNLTTFGQSNLTFGTPASSAPSGLTFGTPFTTTTSQPTLGFPTPTINFATPATATTTTTAGFGVGTFSSNLGATTSAATGFQGFQGLTTSKPSSLFGTPASTTSTLTGFPAPSTGLTSGFSSAITSTSSNLFGVGGKTFLTTTTATAPVVSTTASVGLGGVDPSQSKAGPTGIIAGRTDNKTVKENQIPNEIVQTIDNFKSFVKGQKNFSSEIARGSAKPLEKVQKDTEQLKQLLSSISSDIQKHFIMAVKLKADSAKCLSHAEMAQHTQDTPPGLQYDNTAPLQYFQDLVAGFEHDLQLLSQEIQNTEKHIRSIIQPVPITSEELSLVMRRLHDSFVALAGRLQSVHNSVEAQKEQYMNLRKYILKDSSNIFEDEAKKPSLHASKLVMTKMSAGPTPFSVLGGQDTFGLLSSRSASSKSPLTSGNPLGK